MNAFRTISHVLVATAVVFVSSASAVVEAELAKEFAAIKFALKYNAPMVTNKALKNQNPYLSAFAEGTVAAAVRKQDMSLTQQDGVFLLANAGARSVKTLIANNTGVNAQYLENVCDQNLPESVSTVVKYLAPMGLEFVYNSIAGSVADCFAQAPGQPRQQ